MEGTVIHVQHENACSGVDGQHVHDRAFTKESAMGSVFDRSLRALEDDLQFGTRIVTIQRQ